MGATESMAATELAWDPNQVTRSPLYWIKFGRHAAVRRGMRWEIHLFHSRLALLSEEENWDVCIVRVGPVAFLIKDDCCWDRDVFWGLLHIDSGSVLAQY